MTAGRANRRAAGGALAECDVVMKGGVTSGVVYPGAIIELARHYRFRRIGGTSAGAIAATTAAAAEFRRQCQGGGGGFAESLAPLVNDLATPGFLAGLLHPSPETRPILELVLAALEQGRSGRRRTIRGVAIVLRSKPAAAALPLLAAGVLCWLTLRADGLDVALAATLVAIIVVLGAACAAAAPALLLARAVKRSLDDPTRGFGVCSGRQVDPLRPALVDWLHKTVQDIADLAHDRPLTFDHLKKKGVELSMISTDLGAARPVRFPLDRSGVYRFDPVDMRRLFPDPIVDHLLRHAGGADMTGLYAVPAADLPVLVAVRMSLALPLLFSAVPLYRAEPATPASRDRPSWFSDGGITSNFPVHLFDTWMPECPTFGLDLAPYPGPMSSVGVPDGPEPAVEIGVTGSAPSRWSSVHGVGTFIRQLADAALNWRDNAQADLPGYRERVCRIPLQSFEGGLNLNMRGETVERLMRRGQAAGMALAGAFDEPGWRRHQVLRYLLLMRMLQEGVSGLKLPFASVRGHLDGHLPKDPAYAGQFTSNAQRATASLLRAVARWRRPPRAVDFAAGVPAEPPPVMRVSPRD